MKPPFLPEVLTQHSMSIRAWLRSLDFGDHFSDQVEQQVEGVLTLAAPGGDDGNASQRTESESYKCVALTKNCIPL